MKKASGILNIVMLLVVTLCIFSSCKKEGAYVPSGADNGTGSGPGGVVLPDSSTIGLISYFKFDDNAYDYSGTGSQAGYIYSISSTPDRYSNPYGAFYFNGVNSYIGVPTNSALTLNGTDFTINVWVKLDSYGGPFGSAIADKRGDGPGNGWILSINNSSASNTVKQGSVSFIPGSTDQPVVDTTIIALNRWAMITVMYASAKKQCNIYINGVLSSVKTNVTMPAAGTTADMYIGRDNPGNKSQAYFFNGTIDEFRIFNRTISAGEIKNLLLLD